MDSTSLLPFESPTMFVRISLATSLNWNFVKIRDFELDSDSKIAIGRSKQCSLQVTFAEISRVHCVIAQDRTKSGRFLIYNRSFQAITVGNKVVEPRRIGFLLPNQRVYIFSGRRPIVCFGITDLQFSRNSYVPNIQEAFRQPAIYGCRRQRPYCNAFDYASSQESTYTLSSVGGLTSDESFAAKNFYECQKRLSSASKTKSCPSLPSVPPTPVKGGAKVEVPSPDKKTDPIYDEVYDEGSDEETRSPKKLKKSKGVFHRMKKVVWQKINKCINVCKSR